METTKEEIEQWIKPFQAEGNKKVDVPSSFQDWVKMIMNPPKEGDLNELHVFQTDLFPTIKNYWRAFNCNVLKIPNLIPHVPYALAILDPPYGLGDQHWDKQAFTRENLQTIITNFRYTDPRWQTSQSDFFVTLVVFCSDKQLSPFIEEAEGLGYPCDKMVWCKDFSATTSLFSVFSFSFV